MQQRLIELRQQRGRLLERIANQRHTLSVHATPVAHTLHFGDRLAEYAEQLKRFALDHPAVVGAAVVTLVVFRPSAVLRWGRRGFGLWRTWTAVRAALPGILASRI